MKLEEIGIPTPGVGEVLVRICASGVNPVDTYIRSGSYAQKPALPYTPGKDGAGVVESVGASVLKFKPGDRVLTAEAGTGTSAEFGVFSEKGLIALPENVRFDEGAGVFVPYATAYRALFQKAKAKSGDLVLIHGASGGVGVAAVQWAKNAGLRVIGTAGSTDGIELVKSNGADYAVDHSQTDYMQEILDLSEWRGVDVIIEMLANVNLVKDFEVLAMFGRICVVGNRGSLDFNPRLIMSKDATVTGMALFNAPDDEMAEIHAAIQNGLASGFLKPKVGKRFPLEEIAAAHRAVIEEKAFGKIVLTI